MKSTDASVQIARIEARKNILSAVIGGLVTLTTVLAGHWFSNRGPEQPAGGTTSAAGEVSSIRPGAPELHFDTRHFDEPPEQCAEQAQHSLKSSGLTGRVALDYFAFGRLQQTTGLIWCKADEELVFFVAAGPDAEMCAHVVREMINNF